MVEYHHTSICNSTSNGQSVAKTVNDGSSKQAGTMHKRKYTRKKQNKSRSSKHQHSRNAEEVATFVEEFMQANKGKRRKSVAELTIGDRGGQICHELRDKWIFFRGGMTLFRRAGKLARLMILQYHHHKVKEKNQTQPITKQINWSLEQEYF
eukprot:13886139-Ditylum_brightwellii.AAC.1